MPPYSGGLNATSGTIGYNPQQTQLQNVLGGKAAQGNTLSGIRNQNITNEGNAGNQLYGQYQGFLQNGQSDLNNYAQSAMSAAMPAFNKQMQGVQESEVARGIGGGSLGTSYEGDLQSAFQRNIANAVGQQSMNLYGTQLGSSQGEFNDMEGMYNSNLWGQTNYENQRGQQNAQNFAGILGGLGSAAGGIAGLKKAF